MKTLHRWFRYWPLALLAGAATVALAGGVPSTDYGYDNNGNLHRTGITPYDAACNAFVNTVDRCGSCTNKCPIPLNGQPTCSLSCNATGCTGTCNSPPTCNAGYALCNGTCTGTSGDVNNCGGCGKVCPGVFWGSATCTGGVCGYACSAGTKYTAPTGTCTTCGTRCVYLSSDPLNCGGCGRACPTIANGYQKCVNGTCQYDCKDGFKYTPP